VSENEKFDLDQYSLIQNFITEVNKNLKDLHVHISKYNEELDKNNFPATLKLLPKITLKIKNLDKNLKQNKEIAISSLDNQMLEINSWIVKQKDSKIQENKKTKYKEFFLDNLYEKSKSKKLKIEGRFPDFHCNNFKLKLDERKFSLKLVYGGDNEKMKEFDNWDLDEILDYIYNFYEFFKKINLENELNQIHESFTNCVKNQESGTEWVPIIDILLEYTKIKQIAGNKIPFPERVWFSFLIYKISENPDLRISDKKITRRTATHTASGKSSEHLWIPTKTEDLIGENIMYLSFKNT